MKQILILLAVACSVALLFAGQPIRELQGPTGTGGGASSVPVDVMNFPTDENGILLAVVPVANRVIDLVDSDVTISSGEFWYSEVFSAGSFNWIALQATNQEASATIFCDVHWQLAVGEAWFAGTTSPTPDIPAINTGSFSGTTRRSGLEKVQAPLGRIRCVWQGGSADGLLTDVKVLLRRE